MSIDINGIAYTWHDLEFSLIVDDAPAIVAVRIAALSWGHETTITNVYGAGRAPVDQAIGSYKLDQSTITFQKKGWEAIKAAAPTRWMGVAFSALVKYRNPDEPLRTTAIQGRLQKESEALAVGDDASTIDVLFMPSLIKTNGEIVYPT